MTAFELRLHPFGGELHRGILFYPASQAAEVWDGFREYARTAPDTVSLIFGLDRAGPTLDVPEALKGRPVAYVAWNHSGAAETADSEQSVDRLAIAEYLRATHNLKGAVGEFRIDEQECLVVFKGPGYSADAFINRESGEYDITQTASGAVAVINDLHKGRDTGPVWGPRGWASTGEAPCRRPPSPVPGSVPPAGPVRPR